MIRLHRKECDSELFKKALGNLLKRKDYHVAAPTRKNEMLRREYTRILNKEKGLYGNEIEKRAFKRKPINLYASFFYRKKSYRGTVIDLSENGMSIETMKCLPLKSKFEILIRKTRLKVPVKVSRIISKGHRCRGMGIELVETPSNYIKLVDSFRS
jgi:hypothetical protein